MTKHTFATAHILRTTLALFGLLLGAAPIQSTARAESTQARAAMTSAAQLRTKSGFLACLQKQWLQDFMQFSVAGDNDAANAYIQSNRCVPVRGGWVVTQSATPSAGIVSYVFEGVEFWTVAEAVER